MELTNIPHEVLVKIFSHLKINDLRNLALTCKKLKEATYDTLLWSDATVSLHLTLNTENWSTIYESLHVRGIKSLIFTVEHYTALDVHMSLMATHWPGIVNLKDDTEDGEGVPGQPDILQGLQLRNAKRLKLRSIGVMFCGILLDLMPYLETLDVSQSQFDNRCASNVVHLRRLRELNVANTNLSDFGMASLFGLNRNFIYRFDRMQLKYLRILDLSGCVFVTSTPWSCLRRLRFLNTLILSDGNNTKNLVYRYLARIVTLRCLIVKSFSQGRIIHRLGYYGNRLQCIHLSVDVFSDAVMLQFNHGYKELIYLKVDSMSLTDKGVEHISLLLPQLKILDLSGCHRITGMSIRHIKGLRNLQLLRILKTPEITQFNVNSMPSSCCVHSDYGFTPSSIDLNEFSNDPDVLIWLNRIFAEV
uniref:F-box domain-containing protein n=1 Tax=Biomphalaria glabrata TaxID=6526 RepID=A0A2C9LYI8_BIOGL